MIQGDKFFCPTDDNIYEYYTTRKATDRKTNLLIFKYVSKWNNKEQEVELKEDQFNNLINNNKIWQKKQ